MMSNVTVDSGFWNRNNTKRRKSVKVNYKNANWDVLAIYVISASTFMTLVSIFGPTMYIVQHHEANHSVDVRRVSVETAPIDVDVDDLEHEEFFRNTIKSCLPAQNPKCGEFVPEAPTSKTERNEKRQRKVQRVALIAPPGDMANSLFKRVEQVVDEHNKMIHLHPEKETGDDPEWLGIELVSTSHVPPYGYGKTHGYTKIVRLIPEPLLLEVTDALTASLLPGESHTVVTIRDIQATLRMILRFHCRLSHLAAHTAILSIRLMDLLSDPVSTMRSLHTFLTPKDRSSLKTDEEEFVFTVDDDQSGLMDVELAYESQMLTHVQTLLQSNHSNDSNNNEKDNVQELLLDLLDRVLLDEFQKSKNMTVWPCPSFWSAATESFADASTPTTHDNPQNLYSPLLQRLAQSLSPDCDDPFNTCFVERDKCEFRGDAACAKQ